MKLSDKTLLFLKFLQVAIILTFCSFQIGYDIVFDNRLEQMEGVIIENEQLHADYYYVQRLNDLLTGRLYEQTKFITGQIDPTLDTYQRFIDKLEIDLNKVAKMRDNALERRHR
jgi:hypothetical protein